MREKIIEIIEKHGTFNGNIMGYDTYVVWKDDLADALLKLSKENIEKIYSKLQGHGTTYVKKWIKEYYNIGENDNKCLCCGAIIPEGRQVCPNCEIRGDN